MFDLMGMMGKAKEFQAKLKEAQDSLDRVTATGEAGAGLVKATANGKMQVVSVEIDESLLQNPDDRAMVADLTVAAVNAALRHAAEKGREHIKGQTAGLLPNIPGLDLSGFGF